MPPGRSQIAWLLLTLAVLYFCLFRGLDAWRLVGPDEPRYAAIARDMAETGDWVTPRLHGQPWFEKPILYYWAAAIQYKLWGDSEFSARVPSALAAVVLTLALTWLAWKSYSGRAAAMVMLLFPTTVAAIGFGRAATTDMLFTASLVLVMAAATRIIRPGRDPASIEETAYAGVKAPPRQRAWLAWLALCGFGAALGLATLAKGPAAIVLAGGSVGLWALVTRRWREASRLFHPLAILTFCVVALPWYVLCALRNPDFVQVFLISHNFDRFLTPVFQHEQPFWFFVPIVLLALFPWAFLLAGCVPEGLQQIRAGTWRWSPSFFFVCWALFPFVFFSLSKSKLPGYMLPVIPALVLLLVRSIDKAIDRGDGASGRLLTVLGATLMIFGGLLALPQTTMRLPEADAKAIGVLAFIAVAGGLSAIFFAVRRKSQLAVSAAAIAVALLCFWITHALLPQMDAKRSPRTAAVRVTQLQDGMGAHTYRLHRAWSYGLNYYLKREVLEWSPGDAGGIIVTSAAGLDDLKARGIAVQVVETVSPQAVIARVE